MKIKTKRNKKIPTKLLTPAIELPFNIQKIRWAYTSDPTQRDAFLSDEVNLFLLSALAKEILAMLAIDHPLKDEEGRLKIEWHKTLVPPQLEAKEIKLADYIQRRADALIALGSLLPAAAGQREIMELWQSSNDQTGVWVHVRDEKSLQQAAEWLDDLWRQKTREAIKPTPQSAPLAAGLQIAKDDQLQLLIQYNGRLANNPLSKSDHYTHILYYIITQSKLGHRTFTVAALMKYLENVHAKTPFARSIRVGREPDKLRKSRDRHLQRIAAYLRGEFPELGAIEIYQPVAGGFEWLLE